MKPASLVLLRASGLEINTPAERTLFRGLNLVLEVSHDDDFLDRVGVRDTILLEPSHSGTSATDRS